MLKLLQEIRGMEELGKRRSPYRPPGLFLVQLRTHVLRTTMPRRPLTIQISEPVIAELPDPVRITHR